MKIRFKILTVQDIRHLFRKTKHILMSVYKSSGTHLVPEIKVSKCKVVGDGSSAVFLRAYRKCISLVTCDKGVNSEHRSLQSSKVTSCNKIVVYTTFVLWLPWTFQVSKVKIRIVHKSKMLRCYSYRVQRIFHLSHFFISMINVG